MKARDLRTLSIAELDQKIKEVSQELATLKIKHESGADVEKPGRIKIMRREIARMKTVRTELEQGAK